MACYYRCVKKVGTQRGVTTQGLQRLHAPSASFCNPLRRSRRQQHPKAGGMGGAVPPRQGAGSRSAGRGGGPPGAPGPARPAPPRPSPSRTYPAGRSPGAPAVVISEGGGQRAPAGRQLRPRCCRRNPSPLLYSGAADAAAGEGRARGGEGGGAGPGLGLPTRAVEPRSPPACGLRPNSRLRQVRAPGGPCPGTLCAQPPGTGSSLLPHTAPPIWGQKVPLC